jgi:hypothetical protein
LLTVNQLTKKLKICQYFVVADSKWLLEPQAFNTVIDKQTRKRKLLFKISKDPFKRISQAIEEGKG